MARRLYRSRHDRILGGVAAGVAQYFSIDPTIVRLAWLLDRIVGRRGHTVVPHRMGARAAGNRKVGSYTAAGYDRMPWESSTGRGGARGLDDERERRLVGWVLVGMGALIMLSKVGIIGWLFSPSVMLAVLFIVAGLYFLGKNGAHTESSIVPSSREGDGSRTGDTSSTGNIEYRQRFMRRTA